MRRIVAVLVLVAGGLLAPPAHAVELRRCGGAMCGSIERPLDPARPDGRKIDVAFRLYQPARRSSLPPIVAVEGGPGYPSTGSRVEFRGIFGPLLRNRALLLVDNRGTGDSALIDCRRMQFFAGRTSGSAFARRAGRCARIVEAFHGRGASSLFATAYAADDLAAVMRALELGPAHVYGDSYGTFFVQEFVARHPRLVLSVVLDSAYPRRDLDPWYASSGTAARAAMEIVSPGSVARLGELLARVRAAPLTGRTLDADRSPLNVRVDPRALTDMVQDPASDPVILRELDASIRASLAGDHVPLLRLAGQSNTWSHAPADPAYFSRGAYLAVACLDYPQLFDLRESPAQRRAALAAQTPPDAFAPFSGVEWLTVSGFTQPYDVCLDWPRPIHRPPPVPDRRLDRPVLIVGGDLDSLTPLADAPAIARAIGTNVRVVRLRNTVHVTSQGGTYLSEGTRCARRIIRAFVRTPSRAPDTRCADAIPALHTPHAYPRTLAEAAPATLVAGPDPGEAVRRAATVAAEAFADAVIRSIYSGGGRSPGLRGGESTLGSEGFLLRGVRFVTDATVDGTGTWHAARGQADAELTVNGIGFRLHWDQASPRGEATTAGGSVLSFPAP
jgi:pimeloyl-ACP methyl ester carboxylesterase